jgi:hypothetical protein
MGRRIARVAAAVAAAAALGACGLARMHEEPDPRRSTEEYFRCCRKPSGDYDAGCAVGRALWALITGDDGDPDD